MTLPRRAAIVVLMLAVSGCGAVRSEVPTVANLTFLTREGCVDTVRMRSSLDDALRAMRQPTTYQVIDLATLSATDVRSGYPTPTLLHGDRDLFGMAVPLPPYNTPT
jgi:hypothetical protein